MVTAHSGSKNPKTSLWKTGHSFAPQCSSAHSLAPPRSASLCSLIRSVARSAHSFAHSWESGDVQTKSRLKWNFGPFWTTVQRFSASMWKESENRFEFSVIYFTRVSLALSRAEPFVSTTDNFCITFPFLNNLTIFSEKKKLHTHYWPSYFQFKC